MAYDETLKFLPCLDTSLSPVRHWMFKFWKSPRSSPNPSSTSPRSSPTQQPETSSNSTSINNPPSSASGPATEHAAASITGLGITDGQVDLVSSLDRVKRGATTTEGRRVQLDHPQRADTLEVPSAIGFQEGNGRRRDSTSQGVTFVQFASTSTSGGKGRKSTSTTIGANASRTSIGREGGSSEGAHGTNRSLSPSTMTGGGIRAVSPMSFSPSIASTFHNPYGASVGALSERDPNQIYGQSGSCLVNRCFAGF